MSASVLIVEDNHNIREPLAALLRLKGYVVLESTDGKEALSQLRRSPRPALILLDLMMPVMDGWAFLDLKRKDPLLAGIPVVVMSAVANLQPPGLAPDVVAAVEKPVDMEALLSLVDRYCGVGLDHAASF